MGTERQGPLLVFALMLATAIVMGAVAASAAPESPEVQPSQLQLETPAPPSAPESVTPPASDRKNSDQKNAEGPSKNGKIDNGKSDNGNSDKKQRRINALLLGLFAVMSGHQNAAR